MSTPNLERMYECGDALANVKDKNYAEVIFVLYYVPDNCFFLWTVCPCFDYNDNPVFQHQARYEEILLGVQGDDQTIISCCICQFIATIGSLPLLSASSMRRFC